MKAAPLRAHGELNDRALPRIGETPLDCRARRGVGCRGGARMPEERPLQPFVKESPEPADFTDPRLVQLLEHWNELREAAQTPPSSAIDATRLGFILGWLMIMVPLEGGA